MATKCIFGRIPIRDGEIIIHRVGIVDLKIPSLIDLDKLARYQMYVDTARDKFCLPTLNIKVPLTRKN